jgi:sugar lactone lactonase YvrE
MRMGLGEGVRWDAGAGVVRFVDYDAQRLHAYDPHTGAMRSRALGAPVAALARWGDGPDHVGTARTGFARVADGVALLGPPVADGREEWCNDARCDARGRFWAGTATRGSRAGTGSLYRLDGAAQPPLRMLDGVGMGNGIGWSPDDRTMYFVDSHRRRIDAFAFDVETGTPSERRPFVELAPDDGLPDGLAVDAQGGVWVAIWGAGVVRRHAPSGRLDAIVELPARHVTSVALAPDALYVATATDGDEATPLAGALFRCDVGVAGLPEAAFRG